MKKLAFSVALLGLVVLAACSGDSPTAPSTPPGVPAEWSIVTLTVSESNPLVGAQVQIEALVFNNGLQAADGTTVTFTATGGAFDDGSTETTDDTQNGRARVLFSATEAATYDVFARVETASKKVSVTFQDPGGEALQIFGLIPDFGSDLGGEPVIIEGKGISAPVEVDFILAPGGTFPVVVNSVEESIPLSATGRILITTPTNIVFGDDLVADVRVRVAVATQNQQETTYLNGYTFTPPANPELPAVYALDPNYGHSRGGDQVTIFGRNLETVTRAVFNFRGGDLTAEILSISSDGFQILISTPRFSTIPLVEDEYANFRVENPGGPSNELIEAFRLLADDPEPFIASLSPIAGPLDGGTLVSIFGSGFKVPVQVTFGNLAATDVNVIDDPTPADNDVITCLSPDYSQQGDDPPVTVDVQVTNMLSGKTSNTRGFTYGDILFISGNSPSEGEPGDIVVIYGSGFEDPLQAFFTGGNVELEVQSVSGTQLGARIPPDLPVVCSDQTGQFEVRLIDSNRSAIGGDYTLLGNSPTVTGVEPTFIQSLNNGDDVDPDDIVISGANFSDEVLVRINSFVMSPSSVTVVNENTIEVENIPAPNDFGLVYQVATCTTDLGDPGVRRTPSAVTVTVQNIPGNCTSSLDGALIYQPEDTSCVPVPVLRVDPLNLDFPNVTVGGTPEVLSLTVYNDGGGDMNWFATLGGNGTDAFTPSTMMGFVAANGSATVDVTFDPPAAGTFDATLMFEVIEPDAIGEPQVVSLTGTGDPAP